MAARRPFWKWQCWKSIGFSPYTQVTCYWSLDLIFKAKPKFQSRNWKIQCGCQAAILKVTYLKINKLWSMATNKMRMKIWNWNSKANSSYALETMQPTEYRYWKIQYDRLGLASLTLSWDKNWDSHSPMNGYPSFYPRIALVAPSPGSHFESDIVENQ